MNIINLAGVLVITVLTGCNIDVEVVGNGRVISDPASIDCRESSGTCRIQRYERLELEAKDTMATFRAIPDEDHVLVDWHGDCDEELANKCRVILGDDVSVKAVFKPISYVDEPGPIEKRVVFIAMGDTGTGQQGQYAVARAIATWCASRQCDLVLGMGDNFYGVTPTQASDALFEERFEHPYADLSLPFYMILGNHDTGRYSDGDGGDQSKGNVQVEYHYRTDRLSTKWQMPSRYYRFSLPVGDAEPLVEFFAIDSAPFVGAWDTDNDYPPSSYARQQGDWLSEAVTASRASWKLAFAHHPYISNGKHGNASNYDGAPVANGEVLEKLNGLIFRDFMEDYVCNRVDWLFSGHDHNMQLLKPAAPCGFTQFAVSGAGAKANSLHRPYDNGNYFQIGNTIGFMYVEVMGNQMTITTVSANGDGSSPKLMHKETFGRIDRNG